MKKIKYIVLGLLAIGSFSSCDVDNDLDQIAEVEVIYDDPTSGTADFSSYVAIGNSLSAGFADNALFLTSQINSFPNIISQMMEPMGGGAFNQPLMDDNIGGMLLPGGNILTPRLYFYSDQDPDDDFDSGPYPVGVIPHLGDFTPDAPTTNVANNIFNSADPFNNMGIPGAKSFHLLAPGYGNILGLPNLANPYFIRMASTSNATVIGDAMLSDPTFFSLWIGNNDVLGYAITGGDGSNPITDVTTFTQAYGAIVTTLTSGGAKGIVANIPYVTSIPHFTTVPHNPVPLDADKAGQLNAQLLGPVIQILTALGQRDRISLLEAAENNPLLILDEDLTDLSAQLTGALQQAGVSADQATLMGSLYGKARHATSADLITLPTSGIIGDETNVVPAPFNSIGVTYPLGDTNVLIPSEQVAIQNATDAFNVVIANIVSANDLAFIDANALLAELATSGLEFDDFNFSSSLVFGGVFSLDGIHLTSRGYALMANKILEAIDLKYGSNFTASGNVPKADNYPTNYPTGI